MIKQFDSPETAISALADFVVAHAAESISRHGTFTLALSGGSSPKKLYQLLASAAYRNKVEWNKTYFFFGDERYVPLDDPESNFRMASESLFQPLGISAKQIFPVNTKLPPTEAALGYERQMIDYFRPGPCRFDLILLGLGDNSHTASLFPHTAILHEKEALIKEVYVEEVSMYRISFTAPLINSAACIAFLVYGPSKAEAVRHILQDPFLPEEYPAQLIRPGDGKVYWFLDNAAGKNLNS